MLAQVERDQNLLTLPAGELRQLQLIFDGHGWTSKSGAVRFVLRCTQTTKDHNSDRNARTPIFIVGDDTAVRRNGSCHKALGNGVIGGADEDGGDRRAGGRRARRCSTTDPMFLRKH